MAADGDGLGRDEQQLTGIYGNKRGITNDAIAWREGLVAWKEDRLALSIGDCHEATIGSGIETVAAGSLHRQIDTDVIARLIAAAVVNRREV